MKLERTTLLDVQHALATNGKNIFEEGHLPEITEAEIERLSLIRYQLLVAAEQVRQPPPINVFAINSMA